MRDPLKLAATGFLQSDPVILLAAGIFASALQFVTFYAAARHEDVLFIDLGVGFLNNYGLLSTLVGNAVLPYLARRYYEDVHAFADSEAVKQVSVINLGLSKLKRMLLLDGRFRFILYGFVFIGLVFWVENTSIHVLGDVEAHWGHKVFDWWTTRWAFTSTG